MTARGTVLVVDDDDDVRISVAGILHLEGYVVLEAGNGHEALDTLARGARPDCILLDMMMPILDGWGFHAEQQSQPELAAIPVIVFTAHGIAADIARDLNTAGYLQKPVHLAELLATVEKFAS